MSAGYSDLAGKVARRYAEALLELAVECGQVREVGEHLQRFVALWLKSEALRDVYADPNVPPASASALLRALAEKTSLHALVASTLDLMSKRRRIRYIEEMTACYFELAEERANVVRAEVTTASDLPDAYFDELRSVLEHATGSKVVIERKRDPVILGGVITRMGDRVFDGSLASRVREMQERLQTLETTSVEAGRG